MNYNVKPSQIKGEINYECERSPKSRYKNLNRINPAEIADLINSDPRYRELFDIHSALRFLDRFVKFDGDYPEPDIEIQSKRLLDKLTEMIKKTYENAEGTRMHHYKEKGTELASTYIILKVDENDKEAIELFEGKDILIGLQERQYGKNYKKSTKVKSRRAIISTIYPIEQNS